ncbi:Serine/threonine-protein phosphatase 6 regulatory ankyrin repeat subunit, partial [Globisporangium splendens]
MSWVLRLDGGKALTIPVSRIPANRLEPSACNKQLIQACRAGNKRIVKLLLAIDACPNAVVDHCTPLFAACVDGHVDIMKILIASGADVNECGGRALLCAWLKRRADMVDALLAHEVNVDVPYADRQDRLARAIERGDVDMTDALLASGADANQKNRLYVLPIIIATEKGHSEIIKILVASGAIVDSTDDRGETPLLCAVRDSAVDTIRVLLDLKANVDKANSADCTPLHIAAKLDHLDIVRVLLAADADVNNANIKGDTPLIIAVGYGHLKIAQALMAAGAALEVANDHGNTTLLVAAARYDFPAMKELIAADANAHVLASNVDALLAAATQWGHTGTVLLLLDQLRPSKIWPNQASFVSAILQKLSAIGPGLNEFESIWGSIVKRLQEIWTLIVHQELEDKRTVPCKTLQHYMMILFRVTTLTNANS